MNKIILLGYMGSGKTEIAKLLAGKIGFTHLDLDHLIEIREQMSIPELFKNKGDLYFRKVEHLLLKELMASNNQFVLSLGGGTPCYADNHKLLQKDKAISIYLKASIETLYERLAQNKSQRPLIVSETNEDLKEFIAKHLFERSFFYNKASHTVVVDSKSPDAIVSEIEKLLF
ncbi:MAG TPA: shikimate kinase [Flavobacterium sp.]|nr:shikimate kinase [Flavobacterium sp.]